MSKPTPTEVELRLARLERCLGKFRATRVAQGSQFFTDHDSTGCVRVGLYEKLTAESLGKGGYAEGTHKVRAANSDHQPVLVCKTMKKSRMIKKEETIVQLCAEIAVLQYVAPDCPKLNRSFGVYHDATNVYLLLSTVNAPQATLETRLAHIYAHFGNANKLAGLAEEVERYVNEWDTQAKRITHQQKQRMLKKPPLAIPAPVPPLEQKYALRLADVVEGDKTKKEEKEEEDGVEEPSNNEVLLSQAVIDAGTRAILAKQHTVFEDGIVTSVLRSVSLRGKNGGKDPKEFGVFGNLLQLLNEDYTFKKPLRKHFREAKAKVILKQLLEGLQYMHGGSPCEQCQHDQCGSKKAAGWVHRDLKLENVIAGISRTSTLLEDEQTGVTKGVRFREKIEVQIIDFGLAKHVVPEGSAVVTPSPGYYGQKVASATTAGGAGGVGGGPLPEGHFPSTTVSSGSGASLGMWNPAISPPTPSTTAAGVASGKHAPRHTFILPVTPKGTWQGWMALQGLVGVFDKYFGEQKPWADGGGPLLPKWWSSSEELPKFDIWVAGVIFYCMTHGEMPFEPLERPYTDKEILEDLIAKVKKGREPDQSLEEGTRRLITAMLHNDPKQRPTAAECLNDACFADVTDTFVYEIDLQGEYSPVLDIPTPPPMAAAGLPSAEVALQPSSDDEGLAPREEAPTSSDGTKSDEGATVSTLPIAKSDDDDEFLGWGNMERLLAMRPADE